MADELERMATNRDRMAMDSEVAVPNLMSGFSYPGSIREVDLPESYPGREVSDCVSLRNSNRGRSIRLKRIDRVSCGWLDRVVFVERRNRFKGGVLGSFSIDLMGFWTIEFFSPPTFGVTARESFHVWPLK